MACFSQVQRNGGGGLHNGYQPGRQKGGGESGNSGHSGNSGQPTAAKYMKRLLSPSSQDRVPYRWYFFVLLPTNQCCGSGSGVGYVSGSGVESGINHFGSGSGQPLSGMNLKQNFSDKIHNFSTRLYIYTFPFTIPYWSGVLLLYMIGCYQTSVLTPYKKL